MAIGTGTGSIQVTDPLTNATTGSIFTVFLSNWAALTAGSSVNVGTGGANTAASGAGNVQGAVRLGTAFPNDQYAQCTINGVVTGGFFGLLLRGSTASGGSGYSLVCTNTLWTAYKIVNGTITQIGASVGTQTFAVGDKILFQVVGSFLRAWHTVGTTTTLMWQYYDSSIASGSPGIAGGNAAPSNTITNWVGGNAVADPFLFPGFTIPGAPVAIAGLAGSFTANVWKTGISVNCDPNGVTGPPPTATGLILAWNSTNATTVRIVTRPTGSTFNTQPPAGTESTGANQQGIIFTNCKIVPGTPATAQFDMMLNSVGTGFSVSVSGYFGPETVWFDPPIVINPTGTMTTASPYTAQWSSLTPSIPGCAAVITDVWGVAAEIQPSTYGTGELTKWLPSGGIAHPMICGYGTGWYVFTADNSTTAPTILVRGYMKSGITWELTATDVSPTGTGTSYPAVSSAAVSAGYNGLLYQIHSSSPYVLYNPWAGSFSGASSAANAQTQWVVGNNTALVRCNNTTTPFTVGEQAYFVGVVPASGTVAPTSSKGIVTIRSTSQTG